MTEPTAEPRFRWLPLGLAAAVTAAAVLVPLAPPEVRPWGFAAFGAVGLFAAARGGRLGLPAALLLTIGGKLTFDLVHYAVAPFDPQFSDLYWPFHNPLMELALFASLAGYALIGWAALRRTTQPWAVAAAALAGSVQFFLFTNFVSWLSQDLHYPLTADGLLQSYINGVPFWRGTLVSDLAFTAVLFGLHAVAVRAMAPAAVPVEETVRS